MADGGGQRCPFVGLQPAMSFVAPQEPSEPLVVEAGRRNSFRKPRFSTRPEPCL